VWTAPDHHGYRASLLLYQSWQLRKLAASRHG
jgi:hypothetical protein